jgi:hypothetical protein
MSEILQAIPNPISNVSSRTYNNAVPALRELIA